MRLFVRGFPAHWKDEDLRKRFDKYGATSARVFLDKKTGKSKKCGIVEIHDEEKARMAMGLENGASATGRGTQRLSVQRDRHDQKGKRGLGDILFPYRFAKRDAGKPFEAEPDNNARQIPFHDELYDGRYDVAFDVEWISRTPVAANPCSDPEVEDRPFKEIEGYGGYDNRWLRVGGRLAISPFTVKSAIANGFANLLGGCIRVPTGIDGHKDQGEGKYPYGGAYKRYRVNRSKSRPGIIRNIKKFDDAWELEIELVEKEYYYAGELPKSLNRGDEVFARIESRGRKPAKILDYRISSSTLQGRMKVTYHGSYSWGMEPYTGATPSVFGDRKRWRHRFYTSNGETKKISVPAWHFNSQNWFKDNMFMGRDQKNDPADPNYVWFQRIDDLKEGDWIYFEDFNREGAVGKNYQFKAPFYHPDTVPEGQQECRDMRRLCPRCAMFGMTDKTERKGRPAVGYRGRFKASALVCYEELKPVEGMMENVPITGDKSKRGVSIKAWRDGSGNIKCRQFLLPIQGEPKPNRRDVDKRDVDGYFDPQLGLIKGIKTYRHGSFENLESFEKFIEGINSRVTLADQQPEIFGLNNKEIKQLEGLPYTHNLRSWAEVCDSGMVFKGTLGAENSSPEEIAALILLLEWDISHHGFKIGVGKAIGLGSMESHIKKLWIRSPDSYKWKSVEIRDSNIMEKLKEHLPETKEGLDCLRKISDLERRINQLDHKFSLAYPPPVSRYWELARKTGLNEKQ